MTPLQKLQMTWAMKYSLRDMTPETQTKTDQYQQSTILQQDIEEKAYDLVGPSSFIALRKGFYFPAKKIAKPHLYIKIL